jgi:hypothetical protein
MVVLVMRTEATIFAAYEVRIPLVLAGNRLAYLQLDKEVLLVHWATGTIAHTGDMDECIKVDATRYCNMTYVLEDGQDMGDSVGAREGRILGGVAKHNGMHIHLRHRTSPDKATGGTAQGEVG